MFQRLRLWWHLRRLRNKSSYVRQGAVRGLGMLRHPHSLEPLVALLADEDMSVRRAAATALGELSDARAFEPLLVALRSADPVLRREAATALGKLRDPRAIEPLTPFLSHAEPGFRRAAADALARLGEAHWSSWIHGDLQDLSRLGQSGDARAIDLLICFLRGNDVGLCCLAAQSLGNQSDRRAVEPLIHVLQAKSEVQKFAAESLGKLGDGRAVEPLLQLLGHNDDRVCHAAVEALGRLGDSRAVEPLIEQLGRKERRKGSMFPFHVVRALGNMGDERAVGPLIEALFDDNPTLRRAAAEALEKFGELHAVEPLLNALLRLRRCGSADYDGRAFSVIAHSLAKLGDRRALQPLVESLVDANPAVRRAAAAALADLGEGQWTTWVKGDHGDLRRLGQCGDPRTVEPLIAVLQGTDLKHHLAVQAAAEALGDLGDPRAFKPLVETFVKLRRKDIHERSYWIPTLSLIAKSLAKLADLRAVRPLVQALGDSVAEVRLAAVDALAALGEQDWKTFVRGDRRDMARLGECGDPRAPGALLGALSDPHHPFAADAIQALGKLGDLGAVQPLLQVVRRGHALARVAEEALAGWRDARAVPPLVEALRDESLTVRRAAAHALGELGDPSVADPLIQALQDAAPTVRHVCATALGKLGGGRVVDPLIQCLRDKEPSVRCACAEALGSLGDARAVEPLGDALSDDHRPVREIAATALGELRDARAVEPLIRALVRLRRHRSTEDDVHTLSCLAQSLAKLGDVRAVRPLREAIVDHSAVVRRAAAAALAELGQEKWTTWVKGDNQDFSRLGDCGDPDLVEPFILALREPCGDLRCAAAGELGKLHDVRSLAPLISALRDDCANVRCAAAEALRRLRDVRSVAPLIQGLGDSESSVRCACAEALGELRDARAVEPLIDHLGRRDRAGDGTFIIVVLKALAHLRDVRARPLLVHFLLDYRSDVCAEAAIALGELGDRSAVPPLVQMLGRRDAALRRAAADALVKLGEAGWGTCIKGDSQDMSRLGACRDPRVVEPLVLALREWCSEEREAAARALGNLRDGRAIDPLIQCLTDSDPAVRCACAEALAKLRHRRAVPALLHTLVDHVPEVRRAAVNALEGLGEKKWRRWVKGDSQDASRLGDSGDERLVEPLIRALFEHDSGSADALGKLGHRRIIERLCPMLRDDSKDRRRKAARALIAVAKYHPRLIGEQWNEIQQCVTQPHVDEPIHRDHSDHPATDCYPSETHEIIGHNDHGIGLTFPDWPVRGPAVHAEIVVPIAPETLFAVCPNPKCGKKLQTTSEYLGRTAKCPFCGKVFRLQGPNAHRAVAKPDF